MKMMKFNINDYVKVKLTPFGVEILARKHAELKKEYPSLHEFKMPVIDSEGYTKYQMWHLMQDFGDCLGFGTLPFETTIDIEFKET